jgi:hypothetical protein
VELRAGERYRIRIADIAVNHPRVTVRILRESSPVTWRSLAKDGFPLPASRAVPGPSQMNISSGETADFEFVPDTPGELLFEVRPAPTQPLLGTVRLRVSPP